MNSLKSASAKLGFLACCIGSAVAMAQVPESAQKAFEYPSRNITVLSGYAAGGGGDISTRYFAGKLSALAGKPVIVENKPGASTNIAAEEFTRAKPDGHTIFITAGTATIVVNPHLFKKLAYDPMKDFAPVTTLFRTPFVMVVGAKSPAASLGALSNVLKNKKDKGSYGYYSSFGQATAELYKSMAGLETLGIPYKTPQQALTDLISGELDFMIIDSTLALEQARAGRLRALASTPLRRPALLPDLPTMDELGLTGYDMTAWFAVYAPGATPALIVDRLSNWFNEILGSEETRRFLANTSTEPFPGNPRSLAEFQVRELEKWGRIFRAAKIAPQ